MLSSSSVLKRPKFWLSALAVVVIVAGATLIYDRWLRCHGKPLGRAEALQNATSQLRMLSQDFSLGSPSPSLAEEQYDSVRGTWMFTFRNTTCTVDIITDRCKGTEVGGMTKGCTEQRAH